MLPIALVTLISFLLEVCTTTPVYNMQPAFITNTVGSTTGRNIRNLPCISRRNSNQSGYCMFAIDCLKANGTHLGTCIDGFYFGSCCHIEPVHDVVSNTIDTDIIPHREPPFRITSTTTKTIESVPQQTTTIKIDVDSTSTTINTPTIVVTTPKTATITTSAPTTTSDKFQIVQDSKTTKAPFITESTTDTSTKAPVLVTKTPSTKIPPTSTTIKSSSTPTKPSTVVSTEKTEKPTSARPSNPDSTSKPTKVTQKPTKTPTRISTTTKKSPTTTKTTPATKPTKYASSSSKPTKRVTTTTVKSTTKKISTTAKLTKKPTTTTSSTTPKAQTTLSHVTSGDITAGNVGIVSGNVATNEIDDTQDQNNVQGSSPATTNKPGLVTWTIPDINNVTAPSTLPDFNVTTEGWVPIATPDGWVLLPSVSSNYTTSSPLNQTSTESTPKPSSSTTMSPITLPTPFDKPTVSTTSKVSSTVSTSIIDGGAGVVSTSETAVEGSSIINQLTTESFDKPVNMSDFTDVCGRRMFPEARIVGGEKSSFGKWPWQISLRQWRTSTYLHKCGAALLNENWAITAAHCVDNVAPSDLLLRLGEHDLSTESEPYLHQERRVQIVASHPQFDPRTFEYDLALLRFYEPINFQPNILPVCVPQTDENFVGKTAYVTGWGRLYEDGPLPSILQEVSVPVINNTVCESMYRAAGYIELIPHIFICAGWKRGGFDSCEGDSGGPMVIQRKDNRFLLAGVISWGIGCAEPNQPGVYTRISEFRDWINQILQF
ncbi:serine proteinase stubble [Diorhabda sublineata]|uniref:serine proteinase stubble n=1 Tax=Diorhabda sublineata TaxID=1163346 RepID=UPI0024E0E2E3|nr:serine proteinase stubble [Diorhabda sublineata]